jgi:hypothetical protein
MERASRILTLLFVIALCHLNPLIAQWVQVRGGGGLNVNHLAVSGSNLFAAVNSGYDSGGVVVSTDNGATWSGIGTAQPVRTVTALAAAGSNILQAIDDGGAYLSTNNGASWTTVTPASGSELYVYAFASMSANIYAGTYHGVYVSTDTGSTWKAIDSGMTPYSINAFLVNGSNLFAATSGHGVFLSTNSGAFWTAVNTGLTSTYGYIDALGAINSNLFAGSYQTGIFLSTNNGSSWSSVSTGLAKNISVYYPVLSLVTSGTTIFAAPYGTGVYMSTNNGTSWSAVNLGIKHMGVRALAVLGGYLFAGGDSSGVMRRPLSEFATSVEQTSAGLPAACTLDQNYPNPFNPTTTIRYALPQRSQVKLTVFNALGQAVCTLVNGTEEGGIHEVGFNGNNLASGVYFYRLQSEGFLQTRRLLLIR